MASEQVPITGEKDLTVPIEEYPNLQLEFVQGALIFRAYSLWGDYNGDGLVRAADITPIGLHFGASSDPGSGDYYEFASYLDADMDGIVDAADISPVSFGFGRDFTNSYFDIYESDGPSIPDPPRLVARLKWQLPSDDPGNPPFYKSLLPKAYDTSSDEVEPNGWVPIAGNLYMVRLEDPLNLWSDWVLYAP